MTRYLSLVCSAALLTLAGCTTQPQASHEESRASFDEPLEVVDLKPDPAALRGFEELARSDIRLRKSVILAQNMDFTDEEAAEFWPLHREYETDFARITDRKVAAIKRYAGYGGQLTDAQARSLAQEVFDVEAARVDLKRRYFAKFTRVIPAPKAARFFQIENQLNMAIDLQVAAAIPLVK